MTIGLLLSHSQVKTPIFTPQSWTATESRKAAEARAEQAVIVTAALPHWCPTGTAEVAAMLGLVMP